MLFRVMFDVGEGLRHVVAIQIRGMGPQGLAVVLGPPLLPLRELLGYVREQVRPARFFSLEPFHGGFVQLLLG